MSHLASETCQPCHGKTPPLGEEQIKSLLPQIHSDWKIQGNNHHLERVVSFKGFDPGVQLVRSLGRIAEEEGHHPDLHLRWGELRIEIWTHAIDGLSMSDFVLAAKMDAVI